MGADVALVYSGVTEKEVKEAISRALKLIGFHDHREQVKSVIIKANLCYYWTADTGSTTDPRVVGGMIDCIRERFGSETHIQIAEADASAMRTKHAFRMLGYEDLAKEKKVELVNLSSDATNKESVSVGGKEFTFDIPQSLQRCDLFINVPKLKLLRATRISCALKNIFGCIAYPRKFIYHPSLDEAIVGINKIVRPDLTIADGLVALGRFPARLNLIMSSVDPFSLDWIAAQIMGYRPSDINFLRIAIREKLGDPKGIAIRGEDIDQFRKIFPKESFFFRAWLWNLQFSLLRFYSRLCNDVIPPFLEGT